jgi:hypothetical protein
MLSMICLGGEKMVSNTKIHLEKLLGEPFHALEMIATREDQEEKQGRVTVEDVSSEIKKILENHMEEGEEIEINIIRK